MKPLCVAIYEENETVFDTFERRYGRFFESLSYDAEFLRFTNPDKLMSGLRQKNIHVLICDISLGNRRNMLGLHLIQRVRLRFPDILVVGHSKTTVGHQLSSYRMPTFHIFVDKTSVIADNNDYFEKIGTEFQQLFARNTALKKEDICITGKSPFKAGQETNELLSLIQQITFTAHSDGVDLDVTKANLEPLTGGRSASNVFKLIPRLGDDQRMIGVSTVLKISNRENGLREKENYERFVRWVLPFGWRPEILGFGMTEQHSAICYSFVVEDEASFDALTGFIRQKQLDKFEHVIRSIINPKYQSWYSSQVVQDGDNITNRYMSRYFPEIRWISDAEATLQENVQRYFGAVKTMDTMEVYEEAFESPREVLFGHDHGGYKSCILHGDLNSNNIIMSNDLTNMVFIDFQETGRGHVFEDFIALEASLRIHYPETPSMQEIFENERILATTHGTERFSDDDMYSRLISQIRTAALDNFEDTHKNYLFGVAAYGMRLLRIKEFSDAAKARISASVLWSTRELQNAEA